MKIFILRTLTILQTTKIHNKFITNSYKLYVRNFEGWSGIPSCNQNSLQNPSEFSEVSTQPTRTFLMPTFRQSLGPLGSPEILKIFVDSKNLKSTSGCISDSKGEGYLLKMYRNLNKKHLCRASKARIVSACMPTFRPADHTAFRESKRNDRQICGQKTSSHIIATR